ncbi:MAG: ABC transporter permease [Gammaproteobacteria bacterium]|nr:ABC transporter permease [Gammaproteobacteria bacterium]
MLTADAKPVVLWTDALVYLLLLAITGFVLYARGREHYRDPWRQVLRSRLGMASLVILLAYVLVGLLDSVHFRLPAQAQEQSQEQHYSADVLSVLDLVLGPMREQEEKTYSAPFATHLYAKETVEGEDGQKMRVYPRLQFGGAHLQNPDEDWAEDIGSLGMQGALWGIGCWLLLVSLVVVRLSQLWQKSFSAALKDVVFGKSDVAWHVIFLTMGILFVLIAMIAVYAPKYHVLGTDKVGQDVLYQAIKSIRTGLVIGTLTTLIMLPFAVMLGIMAGYFKGWVDDVIQYLYTTLNSIPGVLLIAAAVLMMQVYMSNHPELFETETHRADLRLFFLCVILGITSWTGLARLLRGEALKLREMEFVQAAEAFGVSKFKIIQRHIQPNVMHLVLIAVVLDFSGLVLAEAVLSYVGVGVDPSMHSWGNLINGARLEMAREPIVWWSLLAAFIFMFVLVLAANLFSDAVRDAFDPRIRKQ